MKRYFEKLDIISAPFYMADGSTSGGSADKKINLELSENNEENCVLLNWNAPDQENRYSYMVYSKNSNSSEFQTRPAKSTVKVLNVYPGVGNNLKGWMENSNGECAEGYGKGLIEVEEVDIDNFNENPEQYMKNKDARWKYDAIYIGAWDGNNGRDLSKSASEAIKSFIKDGRGFISGHDTFVLCNPNLMALAPDVNVSYINNIIGDSNLKITKKGILTNYPWKIGEIGTILRVPFSHTNSQFAMGDVWMQYKDNKYDNQQEEVTENNGQRGTSNFYLTTWNNAAMIQTGHSNGAATPDEQKVIANALFYVSQVTEATSYEEHSGQDLNSPDMPVVDSVSYTQSNNSITVNYKSLKDNGTSYEYYVEATNLETDEKIKSDVKSVTVTTGIKGYILVIDNNADTIPSGDIMTDSEQFNLSIDGIEKENAYVHIAAVDNAGNISEICHYKLDLYSLVKEDVDRDGEFTLLDVAIVGRHYGEKPDDLPQYNTDLVKNGAIDNYDLSLAVDNMIKNKDYPFNN